MIAAHECSSLEEFVNKRCKEDRHLTVNMMQKVLKDLGIKYKSSARWFDLITLVLENEVNGLVFYKHFPSHFCVIKSDYVERFNLTDREYNILKKNGVLKEVTQIPSSRSSSQYLSGFCVDQFFTVTEEELKSQVPAKDLEKAEKLKQARTKALTCVRCNEVQRSYKYIDKEKVCNYCREKEAEIKRINYYANRCKDFLNSDCYVILDTETTGLYGDAEIIELALLDTKGNVLYESLFKPNQPIPIEATSIHKIKNEMVESCPKFSEEWDKIFDIIKDKTLLIYNEDFDVRLINQTLKQQGIISDWIEFDTICIMRFYQEYCQSKYWTKLSYACMDMGIEIEQYHRALGDCKMVLELIKAIANN